MSKVTSVRRVGVEFCDVRRWFEEHMGLDNIDLDDQKVYEYVYHQGRWPDIFQCTSGGAQRLFKQAKPQSVTDIAVLTSIYRPGPLAADVDKIYLAAKNEGKEYEWGDKRINELLSDTYSSLIFQEQVMYMAEKVAGFPPDQCDEVRRAIMKRSISGGSAAKAAVDKMKSDFVAGAVKNGYDEKIASDLYEKIKWFSGYSFNRSHALAYAIDSYYCAWLFTHFEEEWLLSYLEANSHNPVDKARASSVVKSLGYEIVPIDINYAERSWRAMSGKKFMPSFLSCKGIGETAIDEIVAHRPYVSIEDVLWNKDGTWKHSKFNKRGLEALISVGGLNSLDCVGEGKLFATQRQMHHVIIECNQEIRKTSKKEPGKGMARFYELARTTRDLPEWTSKEVVEKHVEYFGSFDSGMLIPASVMRVLGEKDILPVNEYDEQAIYWFIIVAAQTKMSKSGRPYVLAEVMGSTDKRHKMYVWGAKDTSAVSLMEPYIGNVNKSQYGFGANVGQMKRLNV